MFGIIVFGLALSIILVALRRPLTGGSAMAMARYDRRVNGFFRWTIILCFLLMVAIVLAPSPSLALRAFLAGFLPV